MPLMHSPAIDTKLAQPLAHSTFKVIVECPQTFHPDVRALAANVAITMQEKGAPFRLAQVKALAAKADELLLGAGQYSLQNHIIWLLKACDKFEDAATTLKHLESRFGELELDVSCSPAPGVEPRLSPRKLLNAYNALHEDHSNVLSLLPVSMRCFGLRTKVSSRRAEVVPATSACMQTTPNARLIDCAPLLLMFPSR